MGKRSSKKIIMKVLAINLCFILFLEMVVSPAIVYAENTGTQPDISKTPVMEAVEEMTWGVNLADLFHADNSQTQGETKGYYETSPFNLYARFWNGDYVPLANDIGAVKDSPTGLSMEFPKYDPSASRSDWVDFLFIGMWDVSGGQMIKFRFQNSQIVLADGTVEYLEDLDGEYEASTNDFFWQLEGKTPDSKYNGATFITEFVLIEAGSKQAKTDAFYQIGRTKYDAEKMTDTYMEYGMNVFRLPVTWTPFVDENNGYRIDEEWLAAVKKQVDYILSKDAYCILDMYTDYLETSYVNGHWESNWMDDKYKEKVNERFAAIWSQIAEYFKDYGNHLIFETCNEPAMPWKDEEGYYDRQAQRVNELNSIFINSVRKTGGNNETRFLCLAVANYNKYGQLANLTVPDDENLMVQLHSYDEMEERNWDALNSDLTGYETRIQNMLSAVATFKEKHPRVPVIMGEAGVSYLHDEAECTEAVRYFFEKTKEAGIPCLWWEDYFTLNEDADFYDKGGCYWLYDKSKGEWGRPDILAAAMEGLGLTKEDYYTVSYDMCGHGDQPASVRAKCGDKITAPELSLVEGYSFGGWYKDAEYNDAWSFEEDSITADTTLYAKWIENIITGIVAADYEGIYDGAGHSVTVTGSMDGATVTYSTDGITYSTTNPVYINAGIYTVYYKVTKDNYTSLTGTAKVTINQKELSSANTVIAAIADETYTGSALMPTVTLTDKNGNVIPETEYVVGYSNNTEVGTATVTIANKEGGNYYISEPIATTFIIKSDEEEDSGNTPETPGETPDTPSETPETPSETPETPSKPTEEQEQTQLASEQKKQAATLQTKLGLSETEAAEVVMFATKNDIPLETLLVTDRTILNRKDDSDVSGSSFARIQARADKLTNNSVKLKWNRIAGADGYEIYGNKAGKKNKYKSVKMIAKPSTVSFTQKKLEKGTYYKFIVIAYKNVGDSRITIAASKTVFATTTGGTYGVAESVKVNKKSIAMKKNKTFNLKTAEVMKGKKSKRCRGICYESSNSKIAIVSKKGVIKGISEGTCYVYVYAQNGVYEKIKVTVK